jgi:hypothetical protein
MESFSTFGIKPIKQGFVGPQIEVYKVLNKEIVVEKYEIAPSKKKVGTDYLTLQVIVDNQSRVIFTGSRYLIEMIKKVPADKLPFKTTIVKDNDALMFT